MNILTVKTMKLAGVLALGLLVFVNATFAQKETKMENNSKKIIEQAFAKWVAGTGGVFDLLTDDADWTIAGNSPYSKTYQSKKQFIDEVIVPFNKRLSKGLVPTVKRLYADGDTVIALWDGVATAKDGKTYKNNYSWFMKMKDGKIISVVAFFDQADFIDLFDRIPID